MEEDDCLYGPSGAETAAGSSFTDGVFTVVTPFRFHLDLTSGINRLIQQRISHPLVLGTSSGQKGIVAIRLHISFMYLELFWTCFGEDTGT